MFAPKPRDYRINVPTQGSPPGDEERADQQGQRSAKSSCVDKLELTEAKTRNIAAMLKALGADKKALIVTEDDNEMRRSREQQHSDREDHAYVGSLNVVRHPELRQVHHHRRTPCKRVEEVYAE